MKDLVMGAVHHYLPHFSNLCKMESFFLQKETLRKLRIVMLQAWGRVCSLRASGAWQPWVEDGASHVCGTDPRAFVGKTRGS